MYKKTSKLPNEFNLSSRSDNVVRAVGKHKDGKSPIGRVGAPGNTIGGSSPNEGNVISGNYVGLLVGSGAGGGVPQNVIQGNLIGTDKTGKFGLGNHIGVDMRSSNSTLGGSIPGAGNGISGNDLGVLIPGDSTGNSILRVEPGVLILENTCNPKYKKLQNELPQRETLWARAAFERELRPNRQTPRNPSSSRACYRRQV